MKVLLTTLPAVGHFYPMVPLAWALQAAGHRVLVATDADFADLAVASGLPAAPVLAPVDVMALLRPDPSCGPVRAPEYVGQRCAKAAMRAFPAIRSLVEEWHPNLVIAEPMEFSGPAAASTAGLPWVRHWWGLAPEPEMIAMATATLDRELSARGLTPLTEPARTLDVCPSEFQLPDTPPALPMQYVPYNGAARIPEWLFAGTKTDRVCLTLGTILPRRDPGQVAIWRLVLRALSELGLDVVVAIAQEYASLLGELPHAVRAEPLPLGGLLPSCVALVHHGGSGGTMAALTHGIPQLVIPHFADQFNNARRIAATGVGVELPRTVRDMVQFRDACRSVVGDGPHRAAAQRLAVENRSRPCPAEVVAGLSALVGGGA